MNREIKLFMPRLLSWLSIVLAVATMAASTNSALAQSEIIELRGILNIIWGNIGPDLPPDHPTAPEYLLVDDSGQVFALDSVEEVTKEAGGPLRFNRKRVRITGNLDPETNRVKVLTVEQEAPPEVESHIWGDHRLGPQKWVTILCRFGDSTGVTPEPVTFFEDLMTFMDNYWKELSYDNINLSGSQVVGWFNLPQSRAAYLDDPTTHFAGHTLNFGKIAEDCTAAADAAVNFPDFDGINLMFNQDLDCCSWGGSLTLTRDGVTETYHMTWMATWGWGNQGVLGQEMGHGFGLPHSSGPYAATYDSNWDVMSNAFGTCSLPGPDFGCVGVHTIGLHKDALGWIPDARRYVATSDPNQLIFIERLAQPGASEFLVAKIPIGGSTTNFYTVESRKFVGFDNQVPGEAIVIHTVDTTRGDRNAQVVDPDGNDDPNDDGAQWLPGERFEDTVNNISVCVTEETDSGFWVAINCTVDFPSFTCFGKPATIIGTDGNNALNGTLGNDVIVGLGGNDAINGGGGDDFICGGDGNDVINAGAGNNKVDGGTGIDVINASVGNDILNGGVDNDALNSGAGNDTLDGGPGFDILTGGPGSDTCINGELNISCS